MILKQQTQFQTHAPQSISHVQKQHSAIKTRKSHNVTIRKRDICVRCTQNTTWSILTTHNQPVDFQRTNTTSDCNTMKSRNYLAGTACWQSTALVIKRLQVRIPARAAREFSSPELISWADSYSVSVPPHVTTVALKRPQSFCKKCRGRLHLNTYTSLTQRSWSGLTMLSRHGAGTYQGNELICNLSGNLAIVISAR